MHTTIDAVVTATTSYTDDDDIDYVVTEIRGYSYYCCCYYLYCQ